MNKQRRKSQGEINDKISEAKDLLQELLEEEKEVMDNIPENLQFTERYENICECCSDLEDAVCSLEEALDYIESALG